VHGISVDGWAAKWSRSDDELTVTPQDRVAQGTLVHGRRALRRRARGARGWLGRASTPTTVVVIIGEPHVASSWFPVNDHPSDKATYTIEVTVPKGLEAVSNGVLRNKKDARRSLGRSCGR